MIPPWLRPGLYGAGAIGLAAPAVYAAYRYATRTIRSGRGWTAEGDVKLNSWIEAAMDAIRAELPSDPAYDLLVTQGYRTGADQAAAMKWRIDRHGADATVAIYADKALARQVVDLIVAGDMAGAAALLDAHPEFSRHMGGEAADISVTRSAVSVEIPDADRAARSEKVRAAARSAGYSVADNETDVIHVQG